MSKKLKPYKEKIREGEVLTPGTLTVEEHFDKIINIREELKRNTVEFAISINELRKEHPLLTLDEIGERLSMSKGTLSKWVSIGEHRIVSASKRNLPSSFSGLYQLVLLDSDFQKHYGEGQGKKKFDELFSTYDFQSDTDGTLVNDVYSKRKQFIITSKKKLREKQVKDYYGAGKTEVVKQTKVYTIKELLKTDVYFNGYIVIPTKEQISEWKNLKLKSYIHDNYPLTDTRNTHHNSNQHCLIKVPIKDLEVGIMCLNAWGFTYRDSLIPQQKEQGFKRMINEEIIVRGERGQPNKLEIKSIKSVSTDDIMDFVEQLEKPPYLLVGEVSERKSWLSCVG